MISNDFKESQGIEERTDDRKVCWVLVFGQEWDADGGITLAEVF